MQLAECIHKTHVFFLYIYKNTYKYTNIHHVYIAALVYHTHRHIHTYIINTLKIEQRPLNRKRKEKNRFMCTK